MLAVLSLAGLGLRQAGATKNALAAAMNAAAVAVFAGGGGVHWLAAVSLGVGAIAGGQVGAWLLRRVDDRKLRLGVVALGVALTIGLFLRAP